MKKVLFLAIAALAYAGSVNAQTEVTVLASLPTANAVTVTPILTAGIWGTDFGGAANTTITSTNSVRMTTAGTYKFQATSSAWATLVGTNWNTLFAGSMFEFTGTDVTFKDASNDGVSTLLGSGATYDLTLTPAATATAFSFEEHLIKLGATDFTGTNDLGCGSAYSIGIKPVSEVDWATNTAADLKVSKTAICQSLVADNAIVINIELKNNADIDKYYIGGTLTGPTGSSILFASKYFSATTTDGSLTLDVFGKAKTMNSLATYAGAKAGIYTFTLNRGTDNIASNADNASTLGIDLTTEAKTVDFAILPSPIPTLTTATIK